MKVYSFTLALLSKSYETLQSYGQTYWSKMIDIHDKSLNANIKS